MISCRRLDIGVTEGGYKNTLHTNMGDSQQPLFFIFLGFYSPMKNSKHGVQENLRRSQIHTRMLLSHDTKNEAGREEY